MFKEKSIFNIKNNKLLLIEGNDKNKFIQGIISNDIELLKKNQFTLNSYPHKEDFYMIFLLQLLMINFF